MARASTRKNTNELEFQGQVLNWLNGAIANRPALGLDRATQEKPRQQSGKRNDLVIWRDRGNEIAFLAIELKTPTTPINDPVLHADAIEKAQKWRAAYFCVWNMTQLELYATPAAGKIVLPSDVIFRSDAIRVLVSVEDWLKPEAEAQLKHSALALLDAAVEHSLSGDEVGVAIDAEIFVARLTDAIGKLRGLIYNDLAKRAHADKRLRQRLNSIAAEQGFLGFVEDINYAVAGQIGYRYVGQILFYHALRRKIVTLPAIELRDRDPIPGALGRYWNEVRRYDYEALFGPHALDEIVSLGPDAQFLVKQLISQLAAYDWSSLTDDVLGSIFEHLIPSAEQMLLGQFYTPRPVADLLVGFTIDGDRPLVLDPGCGSGTFLMSAYDYLSKTRHLPHRDLLSTIWGFDISPFAAELAVINLYRQDMAEYENFPRIVTGSFIDRHSGEAIEFPAPRIAPNTPEKVDVPIPRFTAILANPPYVRSQHQDDLDPRYRDKLFTAAMSAGIKAPPKTDLFAFFIYHSLNFLAPGARIGFVTSSSWLTADFAAALQECLLTKFRLIAVVASRAESFFSQVEVNTVLIIAERRETADGPDVDEQIRFVSLKQRLEELLPASTTYWKNVEALTDRIETAGEDAEADQFRVKLVGSADELAALRADRTKPRNWSKYLRAPISYFEIFES